MAEHVENVALENIWNMTIFFLFPKEEAVQQEIFNYYVKTVIEVNIIKYRFIVVIEFRNCLAFCFLIFYFSFILCYFQKIANITMQNKINIKHDNNRRKSSCSFN